MRLAQKLLEVWEQRPEAVMALVEVWSPACSCICRDRIRRLRLLSFLRENFVVVAAEARREMSDRKRFLRLPRRGIERRLRGLAVLAGEEVVFRDLAVWERSQVEEEGRWWVLVTLREVSGQDRKVFVMLVVGLAVSCLMGEVWA